MSRQVVEIPIEVWEQCQRDAETIAALHKECLRINAEVERLRKAGDAMAYIMAYENDSEFNGFVDAWNAAKEGKPDTDKVEIDDETWDRENKAYKEARAKEAKAKEGKQS